MSFDLGSVWASARVNTTTLSSDVSRGVRAYQQLEQGADNATRNMNASGNRMLSGFRSMVSGMTQVAGGIVLANVFSRGEQAATSFFRTMITGNSQMEQFKNTLSTVLKSEQAATDTLEWARKFAAKTPYEIPEVIQAVVRLQSYGMNAKQVLQDIGDMTSVMGPDFLSGVEAIADAEVGEMERLKEFGITKKMIADEAEKLNLGEVINNKNQITNQENFNAALFGLMRERYQGGMDLQSKTFAGMISNLKDFIGTFTRNVGSGLFDRVKDMIQKMQNLIADDAFLAKSEAFAKKLGDALGGMFDYGLKMATGLYDLLQKLQPVLSPVATTLGNIFAVLPDIGTGLGQFWTGLNAPNGDADLGKIEGILNRLFGPGGGDALRTNLASMANAWQTWVGWISQTRGAIENASGGARDFLTQWGPVGTLMNDIVQFAFFDKLRLGTDLLSGDFKQFGQDLRSQFGSVLQIGRDFVTFWQTTVWPVLNHMWGDLQREVWPEVVKGFTEIGKAVRETGDWISDNQDDWKGLWDSIKPFAEFAWDVIVLGLKGMATGLQLIATQIRLWRGVIDAAIGWLRVLLDTISTIGKVLRDVASGDFQQAWREMGGWTKKISDDLGQIWQGLCELVPEQVKKMVQLVIAYFQDLWDALVGHSIVPDIINGILAQFGRLAIEGVPIVGQGLTGILGMFQQADGAIVDDTEQTLSHVQQLYQQWANELIITRNQALQGIGPLVPDFSAGVWNQAPNKSTEPGWSDQNPFTGVPLGSSPMVFGSGKVAPVSQEYQITSRRGDDMSGLYGVQGATHQGIDVAVPEGSTVVAPEAGQVELVDWQNSGGYGNLIKLHMTGGRILYLGHMNQFLVKNGTTVGAGQPIGISGGNPNDMGKAAGTSSGAHLHFEMRGPTGAEGVGNEEAYWNSLFAAGATGDYSQQTGLDQTDTSGLTSDTTATSGSSIGTSTIDPVEAAANLVERVGQAAETLQGLRKFVAPTRAVIQYIADSLKMVVEMIQDTANNFDKDGLLAASNFADTADKVTSAIGNACDTLSKTVGFVRPAKETMDEVQGAVEDIVTRVKDMAGRLGEGMEDTAQFTVHAKNVTDFISSALDPVNKLRDFVKPAEGVWNDAYSLISTMIYNIKALVTKWGEDPGITGAESFSTSVKAMVDMVSSALDAIKKMEDFKPPTQGVLQQIGKAIYDIVIDIDTMAKVFEPKNPGDPDAVKEAAEFSADAKTLVDLISSTLDVLAKLSTYAPVTNMSRFWSDFDQLLTSFKTTWEDIPKEVKTAVENAKEAFAGVSQLGGMISSMVDPFVKLQTYKGVPKAAMDAFFVDLQRAVQDFKDNVKGWADTDASTALGEAGDAIGKVGGGMMQMLGVFADLIDQKDKPGLNIQQNIHDKLTALFHWILEAVNLMKSVGGNFQPGELQKIADVASYVKSVGDAMSSFQSAFTTLTKPDAEGMKKDDLTNFLTRFQDFTGAFTPKVDNLTKSLGAFASVSQSIAGFNPAGLAEVNAFNGNINVDMKISHDVKVSGTVTGIDQAWKDALKNEIVTAVYTDLTNKLATAGGGAGA